MKVYFYGLVEDQNDKTGVNYNESEFKALSELKMKLPRRKQMKEILLRVINVVNTVQTTKDWALQIEPQCHRIEIVN